MDRYGNWNTTWTDYIVCHANVNSLYGAEYYAAAQYQQEQSLDFTVRYCLSVMNIDTTNYRILFRGKAYNIEHIDYLSFKKNEIKIRAKQEEKNGRKSED